MRKTFLIIFIIAIVFAAGTGFAFAQEQKYTGKGLVPCGNPGQDPCNFNYLLTTINILINFLLFWITLPIAAILFAYVGFLLLFSGGDEGKRTQAKAIAWNLVVGLVIALAAWLIVKTILVGLGLKAGFSLLEGFK
ncbi:MAG TPA: hypothetical protein VJ103_01525 [Candidatus Paceibacterota bacterium]|nr:hypothetical protein [Candidatus Paceibacterota bacterium]